MNEVYKTAGAESLKNKNELADFQRDADLVYDRAANIIRVFGFAMIGVFVIGCGADLALKYTRHTLTAENAINTFLHPRTLVVGMMFLAFSWTASSIKAHSRTAVVVGRCLAFLLLAAVPIGTIFGIIALVRLFNKNLRCPPL